MRHESKGVGWRKGEGECYVLLRLHEAVVGHHLGEQVAEPSAHVLQIKMLQAPVAGIVEQDHDDHHFRSAIQKISVTLSSVNISGIL